MIALATSILIASVIGSPHCAGMCGGIAAFCAGAGECDGRRSASASAVYHSARLVSYAVVGLLAGAFGILLNSGGALVGIQHVAAIMAGCAVALVGVAVLLQAGGVGLAAMPIPNWMKGMLTLIHRTAAAMPPIRRSMVIGLATPLLPCGWLWAFAAVSSGTGTMLGGLLVMVMFWAGTVPILALVGAGIASLGGDKRRMLAAVAGAAMIGVGVYTAGVRAPLAMLVAERLNDSPSFVVGVSTVDSIQIKKPACCLEGEVDR